MRRETRAFPGGADDRDAAQRIYPERCVLFC